jgi:hypothetical protein
MAWKAAKAARSAGEAANVSNKARLGDKIMNYFARGAENDAAWRASPWFGSEGRLAKSQALNTVDNGLFGAIERLDTVGRVAKMRTLRGVLGQVVGLWKALNPWAKGSTFGTGPDAGARWLFENAGRWGMRGAEASLHISNWF